MSKEMLREVIVEQEKENEEIFSSENIIKREAEERAGGYLKFPNIFAILGVRRCGKSVLALRIFRNKKYGYINFDDERLAGIEARDLNKILEVFYELYGNDLEHIILDEPQNVEKWELFASRLRRTKKVIITGSNSKLLSGELATTLTGRYISFTLFPFSFREVLEFRGVEIEELTTPKRAEVFKSLKDYVELGGFPERFKFGKRIINEIYSSILTKDILRRAKIKKATELKRVSNFLISNFSKEFSYTSLKNITSVRHLSTISKWIDLLEQAYLIFVVERFSFKLKKPLFAPKKVYCVDTGLANTVSFKTSENLGRLAENLVFLGLLRKKYYVNLGLEIYYYKDALQHEVDFVVKEGPGIKQLIQVTYASARDEIEKREIRALRKASKTLKCRDLFVITWDYEGEEVADRKKIKFVPLWKWLLSIDSGAS
ncbi:MAG: ATP-binding protein [Candidatus Micrarchaeota archaeon]|nr:ATP-binding protein [Candidatus Micrarchaeota archaeon]